MGSRQLDYRLPLCGSRQSICRLPKEPVHKKEKEVGIRDADFNCSKVGIPYANFKKKKLFYISEVGIRDADFTVHLLLLHVSCRGDGT